MSFKRRLAAVGMSTAGATVFAATLVLTGQSASAAPLAAACHSASDCPAGVAAGRDDERGRRGYPTPGGPGATAGPAEPTRGSDGYGPESPNPRPTPTNTGPGGGPDEGPTTRPPAGPDAAPSPRPNRPGPDQTPGVVSPDENGGMLPVTGASAVPVAGLGGLLVAFGVVLIRYGRRRSA